MLDDLRHSIHIFRKSPGFAAASAGTLAVAIGATLAIFCVVYGILLRPLPVAHESRLAIVYGVYKALGRSTQPVPLVRYIEWRDHSRSVESIAAITRGTLDLLGERGAERIQAQYVTANLFETLGVAPARGRAFRAGEPGECVVSYALWQRRLGGDPQIIGTWLRTARHACIIVGIMPEGFEHWRETADVWLPLEAQADFQKTRDSAGYSLYRGIARLKPGVTPEAAQLELAPLISDVERKRVTPAGVNVVALRDDVVAVGTRRALTFLGVLGVLVWIIACANVGALLLSRTTGRSPELAIRLALGATRWRILRLTAAESVVIATTGTAAGTFVGLLTLRLLLAFGPPAFARPDLIRMDSTALLAGVALAALTTILVGAVAALAAGKGLESGPRKAGPAPRMVRLQDAIVVGQAATAVLVLVCGALVVRSFVKLQQVDLGFEPGQILTFSMSIPTRIDASRLHQTRDDLHARLAGVPGVRAVTMGTDLPVRPGVGHTSSIRLEDGRRFVNGEPRDVPFTPEVHYIAPGISPRLARASSAAAISTTTILLAPVLSS